MHAQKMCRPTKLDQAPFGVVWRVVRDDDTSELWIQLGDETEAHWSTFGSFLEDVFKERLENSDFIAFLLDEYKTQKK